MQQNATANTFISENSWVILSPIEKRIKDKIESVGIPLKNWDINIYRGVLTGCNDAFIINESKRKQILNNCLDESERHRTAALIRPILRGRDIKRYGYDWADLWLINTHNGVKERSLPKINIENYPAIKAHLDVYWDKIEKRADQGDSPYNLRNCAYMEDFLKPKIVWKRVGSILRFSYDEDGSMALDSTCFATGNYIKYLVTVLNSKMGNYLLRDAPKTGTGDLLVSVQAVEPIKVPIPTEEIEDRFSLYLHQQLNDFSVNRETAINHDIYTLYNLNDEEIEYIENNVDHIG